MTICATPDCRGYHTKSVAHPVGDGRGQPQAFARGLAFEPLENAAQPRAPGGGTDGQPVAFVIRAGLGANLRPRNGGFCGRSVRRIRRRCGQTERGANSQRHRAKHSSLKQFEFGFHKLLIGRGSLRNDFFMVCVHLAGAAITSASVTRNCTVPVGKALLFLILTVENDNAGCADSD